MTGRERRGGEEGGVEGFWSEAVNGKFAAGPKANSSCVRLTGAGWWGLN